MLTAPEVALVNHANLDDGDKVYQEALLLSHLRAIKIAAGNEALDVNNN